jgi:predicted dinucleotide-binding enzyme
MKIGILGSGDVAKALGSGFLSRGHDVMLGTRDASKLADWQKEKGARARVGSFADAAAFGDTVVVSTYGMAAVESIEQAGKSNFDGKVVLDTTNPLRVDDRGLHLAISGEDSLGERIARAIPNAKVVKVFNTVGSPLMVDPKFPGGPADMFFAGDDDGAKDAVATIVRDFGWNAVDLGSMESARYLEAMCMTWVLYGRRTDTWNHAFKFVKT